MAGRLRLLAAAAVAVAATAAVPPAASAISAKQLAERLSANDAALRQSVDTWRASGDPPSTPPPNGVMDASRYLQKQVRFLAKRPKLAKRTARLVRPKLASQIRHLTAASRDLRRLAGGGPRRKLKTGKPPPLAKIVAHYEKAERHHGIDPDILAAIHAVETKFGRVKSKSTAGARGPMQFIPSTWRIYGKGGNIQNPHDAILAAARLLRANGAPRNYARALYAYNPSRLYVRAVKRHAKVIARDRHALAILYCWAP